MKLTGKGGKHLAAKKPEYSKRLIADIRVLLWVVTIGGYRLGSFLHS